MSPFITAITDQLETLVTQLQIEKPEKEFKLALNAANMYWAIHWKSTKLWKTERPLKEYFCLTVYPDSTALSIMGYHRAEDIFEQLEDTHFLYKEKTPEALFELVNEIATQTKNAILAAVDQEFDPNY
ncbi:MAG TPA: hypothetical protein VKZ97_02275 [Flavobacteriaceae bacterium]|nr:hypothetical protein [Flavobacteriaceae bacterium]